MAMVYVRTAPADFHTGPPGLWKEWLSMRRGITVCLIFFLLFLAVSVSAAERAPVTREYFEDLDKESSLQDIVEYAGNYGIEGSGILYFVWPLDDGSRVKVEFDSQGRIAMIYIVGENGSERIYEREYQPAGSGADSAAGPEGVDMDKAVREMEQAIGEQIPPSGRMSFPDPTRPNYELFDVTGDGCADLCKCVTWGSGMVRTDLVVYDPLEKILYVLDGYNYNYLIDRVEEDRIVIVMEGPYGYNEPLVKTYGTVRTEDGRLVFVPDPEEQELPAVGDTVIFGHFAQDNDAGNGKEPIEWIVLDVQDGKALLLSKYGLYAAGYHDSWDECTWETCSLRSWLNDRFLNLAFSEEERSAILTTMVDNSDSQGYDWTLVGDEKISGGNDTQDRIFLLSYAEANRYLDVTIENENNIKSRVAPTAFAITMGASPAGGCRTADGSEAGWWWLRSPGGCLNSGAGVSPAGSLSYMRAFHKDGIVRPAFWLDLNSDPF